MSTPHCSFVIYLFRDFEALPLFIQDFRAFFKKFPLHCELICVIDDNHSKPSIDELKQSAPSNESWQILYNPQKLGRARSLQKGMDHAQADFILLPAVTMSTPLGDIFKILQHLMTDSDLAACWGERYSKKPEQMTQSSRDFLQLENVFNKILKEKNPQSSPDPLCEVGGMRKSAWLKIRNQHNVINKSKWFFAGSCQKKLREQRLPQRFLYVHDSGLRSEDTSMWKLRFELLRQSLFETL